MHAATRSALLLALLPGLAATDNAICKVLSPFINELESVPGLSCSCESDGTGVNIGGDAECDFTFGPPPNIDALKDMKIKFHAGTTVRPCARSRPWHLSKLGSLCPCSRLRKTFARRGWAPAPTTARGPVHPSTMELTRWSMPPS